MRKKLKFFRSITSCVTFYGTQVYILFVKYEIEFCDNMLIQKKYYRCNAVLF